MSSMALCGKTFRKSSSIDDTSDSSEPVSREVKRARPANFTWDEVQRLIKIEVSHAMDNFYSVHSSALNKLEQLIMEDLMPRLQTARDRPVTREEQEQLIRRVLQLLNNVKNVHPLVINVGRSPQRDSQSSSRRSTSPMRRVKQNFEAAVFGGRRRSKFTCELSSTSGHSSNSPTISSISGDGQTLGTHKRPLKCIAGPLEEPKETISRHSSQKASEKSLTSVRGHLTKKMLCIYRNPHCDPNASNSNIKTNDDELVTECSALPLRNRLVSLLSPRNSAWCSSETSSTRLKRLEEIPPAELHRLEQQLFELNMLMLKKSRFSLHLNRYRRCVPLRRHWGVHNNAYPLYKGTKLQRPLCSSDNDSES
ncbi:uncharacterized protein LOC115627158 [Scaptodrosophila lebanonensis]|uniref:Uncharacterized protein LOC115627158 n=1 Tax=Drosophila lebanonensis TaxID=7225 RepID=A0A6J2TPL8_DROLE|nr:uncharacterized protein LOC115627158 [Scaptodrosophila lebanonensis]